MENIHILTFKKIANRYGFTLIELSIVLVIIGLIIGGILLGQSLIRQSEIKSVTTEWEKFETARHIFRDKYNCVAGDCATASSIGLGNNGNGNGYINHVATNRETWQFWQHLANAKLIAGTYTGIEGPGASGYEAIIDQNIPGAKMPNVGYSAYTVSSSWSSSQWLGKARVNTDTAYITGRQVTNELSRGGFLSSGDAYALDIKLDDGIASEGKVRTSNTNSTTYGTTSCVSGADPTFIYTRSSSAQCHLYYWWSN